MLPWITRGGRLNDGPPTALTRSHHAALPAEAVRASGDALGPVSQGHGCRLRPDGTTCSQHNACETTPGDLVNEAGFDHPASLVHSGTGHALATTGSPPCRSDDSRGPELVSDPGATAADLGGVNAAVRLSGWRLLPINAFRHTKRISA